MSSSPPTSTGEMAWRRALVLGGIRSGKSEYGELLAGSNVGGQVGYVATARRIPDDADWNARIDAHRARRPETWQTVECGAHPLDLAEIVAGAARGDTLLIDDLGTWLAGVMEVTSGPGTMAVIDQLAAAVRASSARLVLVSPEVGLSVIPENAAARTFADGLGTANRTIAEACDRVVLVIAGNAVPVKGRL